MKFLHDAEFDLGCLAGLFAAVAALSLVGLICYCIEMVAGNDPDPSPEPYPMESPL